MRTMIPVFLAALPLGAQQTWLVNCNGGPGVDFVDLPAAVAAAAPGDTILLNMACGCQFFGYSAATIDKPLRIVGLDGCQTTGAGPSHAWVHGLLRVTGIAAGEEVLLSNLALSPQTLGLPNGLEVLDCAGMVLCEDVHVRPWFYDLQNKLRVVNSANVILRGTQFELAGIPFAVQDSQVLLSTCNLTHLFLGSVPAPIPGMVLTNSTATLVGTNVGGMGGYGSVGPNSAKPGVELHDSVLRVGPYSGVFGGPLVAGGNTWGYNAPVADSSAVFIDSRAVVN